MKEIFKCACNNEEINSVSLKAPENKQIQNAAAKAITFNLKSALHMRLVAKNKIL